MALGKTILLIEPDPNLRLKYGQWFTAAGYRAVTARSAAHIIRIAHATTPALIILDLSVPTSTGPDLITTLRAHPLTRRTPILVLVVLGETSQIQQALHRGANSYLIRNRITAEELLRSAAALINPQRRRPVAPAD